MPRYIDANDFMMTLKQFTPDRTVKIGAVTLALDAVPTADVVEVVRCKDCKWFNDFGCAIWIVDESDKPRKDDFCSFGERREE